MSYKIRRKWSSRFDEHYVDSFGCECDSFLAKKFDSREEAERNKHRLTWDKEGFSSDWEVVQE